MKTSAEILFDYASEKWQGQEDQRKKFILISDLYAKVMAYSIISKFSFFFSVTLTVVILMFPFFEAFFFEKVTQNHSAFQTALTGLAAVSIAIYNHYKKRQLYIENFMRRIIYFDAIDDGVMKHILEEIEKIDAGFSFSKPELPVNQNLPRTGNKVNP